MTSFQPLHDPPTEARPQGGSRIRLTLAGTSSRPNLTSYSEPTGGSSHLQSTGTNSLLSLPALTALSNASDTVYVEAYSGGQTSLPVLTSITGTSRIEVISQGTGSTINVPLLTSYTDNNGYLTVTGGATLNDGSLNNLKNINITLDLTGTWSYSQITEVQRTARSLCSVFNAVFGRRRHAESAGVFTWIPRDDHPTFDQRNARRRHDL